MYWNQAAWLLAVCPDDAVRAGARAVELATQCCELTEGKDTMFLDTLAAAHATAGNFDKAVELMRQCVRDGPAEHRAQFRARLQLFQARKPYRLP